MSDVILTVKALKLMIKNKPLIDDLDFSINKGEFLAISGIRGSGKTALIKSLLGIIADGLSGEILYHGIGKSDVTYIPQDAMDLKDDFLGTAREIIALGLISKKQGRPIDAIDWKKVDDILIAFRLDDVKDKKINKLTQWQQFKVKMARAIITDPKIIFIDDPTTAVNTKSKSELYKIMKEISQDMNITVVLILPDIKGILPLADKILFLHKKDNTHYFGPPSGFVLPEKESPKKTTTVKKESTAKVKNKK